jgi:alpha-beta hydrolase superfamily lysophospholipase
VTGAADSGVVVTGTLSGAGGVPIYYERAAPAARPRAVVLVSHGYGEHLGRYRVLVAHLRGREVATAAIDHRGHGRSGGARGHCRDFAEMVADLRLLADQAERWWPGVPRVLFGHSMGGLIAVLYLLRHPDTVRAGALSAPALRLPDDGPRSLRWVAAILGRVAPRLALRTNVDAQALSRDPAVASAYDGDPLVHRRATMGFIRALKAAQGITRVEADRLRVPLLIMQGDADRVVDPAGARELAARLTCPHQLEILPGYYHELLNEPPAERARVLALLDAWVDRCLVG